MSGAFKKLLWHYQHRSAEALAQHKAACRWSHSLRTPFLGNISRGAGCFPVRMELDVLDTDAACRFAHGRIPIRTIFNDVLSALGHFFDY